VGIMITKINKILSNNLFSDNQSIIFDRKQQLEKVGREVELGAITFISKKENSLQNLKDLASACGRVAFSHIEEKLGTAYTPWIFISDGFWKPNSLLQEKFGLWRYYQNLINKDPYLIKSKEIKIINNNKVRFAGVLKISDILIDDVIDFTRINHSSVIFFSNKNAAKSYLIRQFFSHAFPKKNGIEQDRIDWPTLASYCCVKDDLLLRVSGLFDDLEAAVDIICTPKMMTRLS